MTGYVAFFRGINVGGHHKVAMADLKALHEALGYEHVASVLQTGNVVFQAKSTKAIDIQKALESAFEKQFGFHSDVMIRPASELDTIISKNPFPEHAAKEPQWLVVMFLATPPTPAAFQTLHNNYPGPEQFQLCDRTLYVVYPHGMGKSKLSGAFIERQLQTSATARNWNTLLKIHTLTKTPS